MEVKGGGEDFNSAFSTAILAVIVSHYASINHNFLQTLFSHSTIHQPRTYTRQCPYPTSKSSLLYNPSRANPELPRAMSEKINTQIFSEKYKTMAGSCTGPSPQNVTGRRN